MKTPTTLSGVILYSVISAAFIGPGTITVALSAGATHQLQLLWAVSLGTIGCLVLQEVSARIVISSGLNLGQATQIGIGVRRGKIVMWVVGGSVMLGCAAYEAGNIMGAVSGLSLFSGIDPLWLTCGIGTVVFMVLWTNKRQVISWLMTALVSMMGIAFFILAFRQSYTVDQLFSAAVFPSFPMGSELLVLGLVGTTIVPYNIFLGSGISKGKTISLMRTGLGISVVVGGIITGAILLAGTSIGAFTTFQELAEVLREKLGPIGALALGVGLFAAGFSSSITAPYAASVIGSTIFGWENTRSLRWIWGIVLGVGFIFGLSGVRPIPVILTVQALNGLILPLLVGLLIGLINHKKLIPQQHRNGFLANTVLLFLFGSVTVIGLNQVDKALLALGIFNRSHFEWIVGISAGLVLLIGILIYRNHRQSQQVK